MSSHKIDADSGTGKSIIRNIHDITIAGTIKRVIAPIAAEDIGVRITNNQVITRATAHMFNADQRVGATHAIIGTPLRQIDADPLRIGAEIVVIHHVLGAIAAHDAIIPLPATEAIIAIATHKGITKIRGIDRGEANQAIRTAKAVSCCPGTQVDENAASDVRGTVISKNAIPPIIINKRVVAAPTKDKKIIDIRSGRGYGDGISAVRAPKNFKTLQRVIALGCRCHGCRIDPRTTTQGSDDSCYGRATIMVVENAVPTS